MSRIVAMTLAALALACGPQERAQTATQETPPVEAPAATGAAPPAAPPAPAAAPAEVAADLEAQSCLDLVASARFAEAVPVCTAALRSNPDNYEVKAAFEKAQAEVVKTAAAGQAAEAAAGAAGQATGGMPKLPE